MKVLFLLLSFIIILCFFDTIVSLKHILNAWKVICCYNLKQFYVKKKKKIFIQQILCKCVLCYSKILWVGITKLLRYLTNYKTGLIAGRQNAQKYFFVKIVICFIFCTSGCCYIFQFFWNNGFFTQSFNVLKWIYLKCMSSNLTTKTLC